VVSSPHPAPVGVLALQGDFERHRAALSRNGLRSREVRRPEELSGLGGLVLPGGESTTMLKFFQSEPWGASLAAFAASGRPILATCAGAILIAREVENPVQPGLGLIDIDVVRNAYGRQLDSFVGRAHRPDGSEMEAVFIRAPKISRVGPGVEVLAASGGDPVLVRQGNIVAATFHPELSEPPALHGEVFSA
jgi:5'-phosphate synthase pdxT subunit